MSEENIQCVCNDCGAEFVRPKTRTHKVCPECAKAHLHECRRRYKSNLKRRQEEQSAHDAMLARLAARDAAFERGGHQPDVVSVRDGLRVVTRGRVCGSAANTRGFAT